MARAGLEALIVVPPTYRHTQPGWVTGSALAAATVVGAVSAPWSTAPWIGYTVVGLLGLAFCLFPSLTVEVDRHQVRLRFGLGPVSRRFPLAEVQEARPVRNRWYWGWGIRLTPHGWLYNVSGLEAVELTLASGRRVRIGTDEAEALARAIEQTRG